MFSAGLDCELKLSRLGSRVTFTQLSLVTGLDDIETFDKDPGRRAIQIRDILTEFQAAIAAPERCLCPVIVAVHGITFGLSIDIMVACDVRYAAADSVFSIKVGDNYTGAFSSF